MYTVVITKEALKDLPKLKSAGLSIKTKQLTSILEKNPYQTPPPYEKLVGDLKGKFSRRINIKHRLVYTVNEESKSVKILSFWTHYEK